MEAEAEVTAAPPAVMALLRILDLKRGRRVLVYYSVEIGYEMNYV